MFKKYYLSIALLATSAICGALYEINGQTIGADGVLHESFGFIPLAYLFFFASIICFLITAIVRRKPSNI